MGKLTVNYAVTQGSIVEVPDFGLFPNGYVFDVDGDDAVIGSEPDVALPEMSAGDRLRAVIAQLDADAESHRTSDADDETHARRLSARAGEIDKTAAHYRSLLDALPRSRD